MTRLMLPDLGNLERERSGSFGAFANYQALITGNQGLEAEEVNRNSNVFYHEFNVDNTSRMLSPRPNQPTSPTLPPG